MTDNTQAALACGLARAASYIGLLLAVVGLVSGLVRSFTGWPLFLVIGGVLGFLVSWAVKVQLVNRLEARESPRRR